MSSDSSNFRSLMRRADTQRRHDHPHQAWWTRYMRGLRRAHHGQNFGTDAEHDLYLNAINDTDQNRAALGRGYRAGLTLTAHEPDE